MAAFGPNGSVQKDPPNGARYAVPSNTKLKRIGLASFLCGIAACISVALIGVLTIFIYYQASAVIDVNPGNAFDSMNFMGGAAMATAMSAMNWYFGYFTIPAAWLVLGLSLGRFPKRQITHTGPYLRWGAIWGAVLVGGTAAISVAVIAQGQATAIIGAALTGALIGTLAGLLCGWLFLAIVRPAEQVRRIALEVF